MENLKAAITALEMANISLAHAHGLVTDMSLGDKLKFYQALKENYELLEEQRKGIYRLLDKMSKSELPEAFEKADCDKIRIPELKRSFYPLTKYSAKMVNGEKGYSWLKSNGGEDLINETVNSSQLAGFLKTKLKDEGIEPPPDVMLLTTYYGIGSSKYTPKD